MYGFTIRFTGLAFEQAITSTLSALNEEGFGVLSDIDVQRALKEKLGVSMPPCRILGACNPPLVYLALQCVPDIGVLLPCNVMVRGETAGRVVVVGFLDPQIMLRLVGTAKVKDVSDAAGYRLHRVRESLDANAPRQIS